ncbi:MAG TPA: asparagine synthase-related protein, partial [Gemmatimonadales bacterium]|nr:asparagine synthase-related protein [Gemmatimonadales bacterium]
LEGAQLVGAQLVGDERRPGPKIVGGLGQEMAVLERYMPRGLFERPKRGFGVPISAWLRGPLGDWAGTLLGERRVAGEGYLETVAVRAIWRQHLSGRRDRPELLWHLLMFQAWHEHWRSAGRVAPVPSAQAVGVA